MLETRNYKVGEDLCWWRDTTVTIVLPVISISVALSDSDNLILCGSFDGVNGKVGFRIDLLTVCVHHIFTIYNLNRMNSCKPVWK